MYAIAINGSPRKGGNTELMLKEVISELNNTGWDTELVQVGGTPIQGCLACGKYSENKDKQCANMRHLGKCINWLGKAIKENHNNKKI